MSSEEGSDTIEEFTGVKVVEQINGDMKAVIHFDTVDEVIEALKKLHDNFGDKE